MDNRDKIIEKQDELIKHLDCLCRIHGYIPGQPQTTSERLIAELSLLREPDKKVMSVEVKCPACESEDIFTVIQRHHKCRGCGIRFCTDMDGNRRNYATLDEAMESHVSAGKNVTNKPTDEEMKEALESMVWQFAYYGEHKGKKVIHTGGLSALEDAFVVLGYNDPKEIPPKEKSNN